MSSNPRVLPTTAENLSYVPHTGKTSMLPTNSGGSSHKRTPEGKPILSRRALLLNRGRTSLAGSSELLKLGGILPTDRQATKQVPRGEKPGKLRKQAKPRKGQYMPTKK